MSDFFLPLTRLTLQDPGPMLPLPRIFLSLTASVIFYSYIHSIIIFRFFINLSRILIVLKQNLLSCLLVRFSSGLKPWKLKIVFCSSLHALSHICNRPGIQMYEEEVGWMNEWVFLYRVVRVKICPLSRVVPKGNGNWGMAVEQKESHYTSPGGKEDEPEQTCPFLPLRISTPFFFFSFPSLSELVCKPFSFRSC